MCSVPKSVNFVKVGLSKKAAYLEALAKGMRRGAAAKSVGVSRESIRLAYHEDPSFLAEIEQAELDACEPVEDALYAQCLKGNVVAIQVWLYNRSSSNWKDQRNFGKMDPVEVLLGKLPAEFANALRDVLGSQVPKSNGQVSPDKPAEPNGRHLPDLVRTIP